MLHLGSRTICRVRASYICASCLTACHASPSSFAHRPTIIPSHHGRALSGTSPRAIDASNDSSIPAPDPIVDVETSPRKAPQKKKKKPPKKASAKPETAQQKKAAPQRATQRQLHVLQGALEALKNVLAAKNIDVSSISKLAQSEGSLPDVKPKPKSKSKPKSKTAKETDEAPRDSTAKKDAQGAKKSAKRKGPAQSPSPSGSEAVEPGTPAQVPPTEQAAELHEGVEEAKPAGANVRRAQSSPHGRHAKTKAVRRGTPKGTPSRPRPKAKSVGKPGGKSASTKKKTPLGEQSDPVTPSWETNKHWKIENVPVQSLRDSLRDLGGVGSDPPSDTDGKDESTTIGKLVSGEARPAAPGKKAKRPPKSRLAISSCDPRMMHLVPIDTEQPAVPSLSYGLERVLFNPGVYQLQEARSRVYNFDPYLSKIMPVQEFDFNALKQYITSSKDTTLISMAKEHGKKYTGSTSSMTSTLAHFHYLLSSWREIDSSMLSRSFVPESSQFTAIMRAPAATFLHWKDGTYAIDADKEYDTANVLSMLGKSMEKLLTLPKEEYEKYRHINSDQITEEERNADEAYHYTGFRDFMMRSQLDAHDPRVPGTGMFDLKTRAVISIRMDAKGYHKGLGYEIRRQFGQWESYEREYYDMIRSAFLKYSLQVRMGRMDGIFVAFHNTQRIFGFQYIPLLEMDQALHGTTNTTIGNREFKLSLSLLNDLLDRATKRFPEQSLRLHFETRKSVDAPFMYVFAKPVQPGDIEAVQNASKASIEKFEKEILGMVNDTAEVEAESSAEHDDALEEEEKDDERPAMDQQMTSLAAWEEVRQMVEDAVDDDELGVGTVREAIEDALEQSGLLRARSSAEARDYVDALLGAITGSKPSEQAGSPSNPLPEENTHEDVDEFVAEHSSSVTHDEMQLETQSPDPEQSPDGEQLSDVQESMNNEEPNQGSVTNMSTTKEELETPTSDVVELPTQDRYVSEHDTLPETEQTSSPDNMPVTSEDLQDDVLTDSNASVSVDERSSEGHIESTAKELEEVDEEEEEDEEDEGEEDEGTDEFEDDAEEGQSKELFNTGTAMSHLKDLIVRMAQRIDERAVAEDELVSSADDSSKLKAFERILGELISRSRGEATQQPTQRSGPDAVTGQTPEAQSDMESMESKTAESSPNAHDPLEQESAGSASATPAESAEEEVEQGELLGMVLTVKNKVNGRYVQRPKHLTKHDEWTIEYNIEELSDQRARIIYQQCKTRRRKTLHNTGDRETEWYQMFDGNLDKSTTRGREFRAREVQQAKSHPVHVMGEKEPLDWNAVFGGDEKHEKSGAEVQEGSGAETEQRVNAEETMGDSSIEGKKDDEAEPKTNSEENREAST